MECHEVNELLSAYVDGMLSEEEASGVGEHLGRCLECRDTYETMTRIIEEMQHMETVSEPEDFVERVRGRLEKRSAVREFARRLFVPVRVKVPIEAVALAAALVLIFYLAGIRQREMMYEIELSMGVPPREEAVEKMMAGREAGVPKEERADAPVMEEHEGGVTSEDKGARKKMGKSAIEVTSEDETAGRIAEDRAPEPKRSVRREKKEVPPLEAALQAAGARLIISEYGEDPATPSSITVEIRAERYQTLLDELARLGMIRSSTPVIAEEGAELIRIRITFSAEMSP